LETRVFLIRHGVTDWHGEQKLLGQRDIPMNEEGLAQARAAAAALAGAGIIEVLSSPLLRAIQTAEIIGEAFGVQIARDPRLSDFRVGRWEGMTYADIGATEEYKKYIDNPLTERIPGGESLLEVQARSVRAVEQTLADNPSGDAICVVTHAGVIRLLLTHYLGSTPANYHRIRVAPGAISILAFSDDRELPRVLAVNWCANLDQVLT
jgi:broad specificity phosphatase PhoE